MSARAWLGLAEAPQQAMPEPGVEDVPWAAAMGPVLRRRVEAIAAAYDGLSAAQRAAVDAGDRWALQAAVDRAYVAEDAGSVFAALEAFDALVGMAMPS